MRRQRRICVVRRTQHVRSQDEERIQNVGMFVLMPVPIIRMQVRTGLQGRFLARPADMPVRMRTRQPGRQQGDTDQQDDSRSGMAETG